MYKVKYREYWNDTHYSFQEKEFSCLEEISDWLFGQMQTKVSSQNMQFVNKLDTKGYCFIEFRPDPLSEKWITIFLITDKDGAIHFSNGHMTDKPYVSKIFSVWMDECMMRVEHPCYKYADDPEGNTSSPSNRILEYLETSYDGAKMNKDTECMERLSRAIGAFQDDPEVSESFVELHFSGYGDDTLGEYNLTGEDYDNCGSGRPIRCIVDCGEKGKLMVTGQYLNGCWAVGISKVGIDGRMPEEDPMPNWDIKIVECPDCTYSTMAVIRIPDVKEEEVHLHWFNDEKPVNG